MSCISIYRKEFLRDKATKMPVDEGIFKSDEEVTWFLANEVRIFQKSTNWWHVRDRMRDKMPWKISNIVAFGIASMGRCEVAGVAKNATSEGAAKQFAFMIGLRKLLIQLGRADENTQSYVQSSKLTPQDEAVLAKSGIEVVNDPDGFLEVDAGSVVLSFSPDFPVRQIVLDIARPAMLLWNKVLDKETDHLNTRRLQPNRDQSSPVPGGMGLGLDGANEELDMLRRGALAAANAGESSDRRFFTVPPDPSSSRVRGVLTEQYQARDFPWIDAGCEVALYIRKPEK